MEKEMCSCCGLPESKLVSWADLERLANQAKGHIFDEKEWATSVIWNTAQICDQIRNGPGACVVSWKCNLFCLIENTLKILRLDIGSSSLCLEITLRNLQVDLKRFDI
jgi:hypothetical protein